MRGLKFIFENTDSNNDEVAALDIGKSIVIAGIMQKDPLAAYFSMTLY
jgi:hypothetical protein